MNAEQAKQIPMKELLASLGHLPAKEVKGELLFFSPASALFVAQAVPSLFVRSSLDRCVKADLDKYVTTLGCVH
jgi:hypothetical protein